MRVRTLEEILEHAMAIVDADGSQAVTVAAIAKAMGMSAPALYRYFPSRDALLDRLLRLVHEQLADTLEHQAAATAGSSPEERLRVLATAYRGWALQYPQRFVMVFGEPTARFNHPAIGTDLAAAGAAAGRGMGVLITVLAEFQCAPPGGSLPPRLERQLQDWWRAQGGQKVPAGALRLAVLTWTRLHGIVSLELAGAFAAINIDPQLLLESELAGLLAIGSKSH